MVELLIRTCKKLLEMGIETFEKSKDMKTLTATVQYKIPHQTRSKFEVFQSSEKKTKTVPSSKSEHLIAIISLTS